MVEKWLDIPCYDGYQVSNLGRVKSLARNFSKKDIILKPLLINSGYYIVNLWKDNKCTHKLIHRLVAEGFINKPSDKNVVNHKAENYLKKIGIKAHSSNIRAVCTGIGKTASGYIWRDL